jgi:hypothetical protein
MTLLSTNYIQKKGLTNFPSNSKKYKSSRKEKKISQMKKLLEKTNVRVAVVDDNAYWVHNNIFYKAPISNHGSIDMENAIEIDVFSLSEKEMSNLLSILDSISD